MQLKVWLARNDTTMIHKVTLEDSECATLHRLSCGGSLVPKYADDWSSFMFDLHLEPDIDRNSIKRLMRLGLVTGTTEFGQPKVVWLTVLGYYIAAEIKGPCA